MCALASPTFGCKRIAFLTRNDARGMYQQGFLVTVQGTFALSELVVANQQTAVSVINVLDDVLVTSVRQDIDGSVAIAGIKISD